MSSHVDNVLIDEIVPRLRHLIPHHVPRVGSEDPEELLQDATLIAVRLLARARVNGKTVTPGNIAYYTLLHLRSGRRSHSASRSDVMGSRTQLVGHSRLDYLDDAVGAPDADEPLTLGDVLASDAEDPSETAARNLDWEALVATLDERALAVLHCLANEIRLQEVATRRGEGATQSKAGATSSRSWCARSWGPMSCTRFSDRRSGAKTCPPCVSS